MNWLRPTFRSGIRGWGGLIAVCCSIGLAFRATAPTVQLETTLFFLGLVVGGLATVGLTYRRRISPVAVVLIASAYVLSIRGRVSYLQIGDPMVWAWVPLTVLAFLRPVRSSVEEPEGRPVAMGRVISVVGAVGVAFLLVGLIPASAQLGVTPGGQGGDASEGQGPNDPLELQRNLDMTQRPNLTDKVVFTVDADYPSFWRTSTFDVWDGSRWSRSDPIVTPNFGAKQTDAHLGPTVSSVQRYRLAVDARSLPAAPNVTSIELGNAEVLFAEGRDPFVLDELGPGSTYEVMSTMLAPTTKQLFAAEGEVPKDVAEQFAQVPVASQRVRELAAELSSSGGTTWEVVQRTQRWLGENTRYSIDAPTAKLGSDVVDDFLFESQLGWCEQVASSMVVLMRLQGIPARLATGYVPGERSSLDGQFVVRESDAHSWTEVWIPELGWMPVDPTASVPLSGQQGDFAQPVPLGVVGAALLAIVGLGLIMAPAARLGRRLWGWIRGRRDQSQASGWMADIETELDALGAKLDRPRRNDESLRAYGHALAERSGSAELRTLGETLDTIRYGPNTVPMDDPSGGQFLRTVREIDVESISAGVTADA